MIGIVFGLGLVFGLVLGKLSVGPANSGPTDGPGDTA